MATRLATRQAALNEDIVGGIYGTATAGAATTLTDTTLLRIGGQSVSRYASHYLYRPAAASSNDFYRRVTPDGYAPTTGVVTHGTPNYTNNPLAGGDSGYYELWPYDPRAINRAFSRALVRDCFTIERNDIVTTGGSIYDFSATPFSAITPMNSPMEQILGIGTLVGTDPNSAVVNWLAAGRSWWPENDGAAVKIRFSSPPSGTLRVTWKNPYTDITVDATSIAIDQTWLMWAMLFEFAKSANHDAKRRNESGSAYESLELYAGQQMLVRRKAYMDLFGAPVINQSPRWASSAPAPQMGRHGARTLYASRTTITGL